MKTQIWKPVLVLIAFGCMVLLLAHQAAAFEPKDFGPEQEFTLFGFLRNNLGVFTDKQDYVLDGDDLASCRTWLRLWRPEIIQ